MSGLGFGENEVLVQLHVSRPTGAFAGTVVAHGTNSTHVRSGETVFGSSDNATNAGETIVCPGSRLARCPKKLSPQEAAILAEKGPTAVRALRLARVSRDSRLLLQDASSCMGALLLQIAKALGANVTALCPDRNVPLVWDLGADEAFAHERKHYKGCYNAIIGTEHHFFREKKQAHLDSEGCRVHIVGRHLWLGDMRMAGNSDIVPSRAILEDLALWVESAGLFPVTVCIACIE